MKIGILSDLHVDLEHRDPGEVLEALAAAIRKNGVDIMIIAGDVANDYEKTLHFLDVIERSSQARCLFVPGNHDIWNENHPGKTAWQTYEALKSFEGNLANGPVALDGGWVVIGDLGWYDYSFGSKRYTREEFDRMEIKGRLWQDKIKAVWDRPTLDMHAYFHEKLQRQLEENRHRRIIMVTHVLPVRDFTVLDHNDLWPYLNAFLGSRQYGELALAHSVDYYICGHVHYRKQVRYANTTFICNCLNYASQWIDNSDPRYEVNRALKCIVIP